MYPGPIFTIDTSSTVTVYFLQATITFHTIRLILCFQQTSEIDKLTVSWGKVLSLCLGFQVVSNTLELFPSSSWFDNLGFITKVTLTAVLITPSSWSFPTNLYSDLSSPRLFLAPLLVSKDNFTRGVFHNHSLYFVFVFLSSFCIVLLSFFQ